MISILAIVLFSGIGIGSDLTYYDSRSIFRHSDNLFRTGASAAPISPPLGFAQQPMDLLYFPHSMSYKSGSQPANPSFLTLSTHDRYAFIRHLPQRFRSRKRGVGELELRGTTATTNVKGFILSCSSNEPNGYV